MKKLILLLFSFALIVNLYCQNDTTSASTIYFVRSTGFTGSARQFKIFMDGALICKITNDCYIMYSVEPGLHVFAVQMDGTEIKESTEKIEIKVEPDKKHYLSVVLETNSIWSKTYFNELTESSALGRMSKIKQINCK
jgi:hypothetical protein